MRSFSRLALLALPLFGSVFAEEPASPTQHVDQSKPIYSSAQEAFRDLLNALPEESLQAALSGLKDFKSGVFESHHRGVEQVHDKNPALATKLVIAAVQDLKKRQTPSNGTSVAPPPPPQTSNTPPQSSNAPPPQQSSDAPPPPASTPNTDRAVIVNVPQTTTDARGSTVVQTTSVLSQVTASVAVTVVRTNSQGQAVTSTENRPAVIRTTTDAQGRSTVVTSAAQFAPTAGEVRTETDARGSTFVTTYTPGGGKISSVKLITTTGADGKPSTMTSYTFVDPAQTPAETPTQTGRPGLQTGAANVVRARELVMMGGAALALFV
ncbi:hypothetical protein FB567DRAFT_550615 [Paraphoma chrysanthemicola]|uniref:Uncharacterized protein n=1 Tax=Paraphoma chrysanthemicola TaxID=798071 RepID=A0A8K0R0J0_9PLEO|nr:hypothetical protein FB567DRAFT_550615 [Paraphoma chrysanthemicola]